MSEVWRRQFVRRRHPIRAEAVGAVRNGLLLALTGVSMAAVIVLIAVFLVTFAFQTGHNPGQSMSPTFKDGQRVLVNKMVYRSSQPRRGDVVMLYYPLNPGKMIIKRLIAEEGDTIQIEDGRVILNNMPQQEPYVSPEFRSHENYGPQVIAEGYCFVMGDHRNNSSDSRHWGLVPKLYIVGRVSAW